MQNVTIVMIITRTTATQLLFCSSHTPELQFPAPFPFLQKATTELARAHTPLTTRWRSHHLGYLAWRYMVTISSSHITQSPQTTQVQIFFRIFLIWSAQPSKLFIFCCSSVSKHNSIFRKRSFLHVLKYKSFFFYVQLEALQPLGVMALLFSCRSFLFFLMWQLTHAGQHLFISIYDIYSIPSCLITFFTMWKTSFYCGRGVIPAPLWLNYLTTLTLLFWYLDISELSVYDNLIYFKSIKK